ncbi:MAG: sigma-54-dependent Fis family transcriptional regulator [Hydrogenophilales bacterium]|nr:sigma-54-dependent Fis family transcriptional regulator [Hydrogenophilales bacterium]
MSEILVVDDEPGIRDLLKEILEDEGYEVRLAENGEEARAARLEKAPDLVLLDIWMPDVDGLSLLKEWVSDELLTMPVVMMSGHGTIHTAVEATRLGAFDFLEKPVPYKKLLATVATALNSRPNRTARPVSLDPLGNGEAIAQRLRQAAQSNAPILLSGEAGTSAELCARFMQVPGTTFLAPDDHSPLSENPLDWLQKSKGGMLFLRDIGKLTPLQQKGLLLLIAKRGEYGVKVVCASSDNLAQMAGDNQYSRDLFNTLSHVAVRIPSLREHREDIAPLAEAALKEAAETQGLGAKRFTQVALERLSKHDWPGNMEELRALANNLAITCLVDEIGLAEVEAVLGSATKANAGALTHLFGLPIKEARDAFEKAYLECMLDECGGSITKVADRSGLERTHLYRKLKQLGVKSHSRNEA